MRNLNGHLLRYCAARSIARVSEFRRWAAPRGGTLVRPADKLLPQWARQAECQVKSADARNFMRLAREARCMHWQVRSKRPASVSINSQRHGFIWKDVEGAVAFSNVLQRDDSPQLQFRRYGQRPRTGSMKSIFKIHVRRRCVRGIIPGISSGRRGGGGVRGNSWPWRYEKNTLLSAQCSRPVPTDLMTCWDLRIAGCRVTGAAGNNNGCHHHILNNFWLWETFTGTF